MATPWLATIVKIGTDDGNWEMADNCGYEVGQEIEVDLDTRTTREFSKNGKKFMTEIIEVAEETQPRMCFPCEMLEL